jgi:hypothetical protein
MASRQICVHDEAALANPAQFSLGSGLARMEDRLPSVDQTHTVIDE